MESNCQLILSQLEELRSAVLQQGKQEKQQEKRIEELTTEVTRLRAQIADLHRQFGLPPPTSQAPASVPTTDARSALNSG